MKYPSKKLVLPAELKTQINGRLDEKLLKKISVGGRMWTGAAIAFNKMNEHAKKDGIELRNIGDYRSFDGQKKMFLDRYSLEDQGRVPTVTRKYEGKTWFLKKGKSPSAAPDPTGKKGSNHGWGLAIDLDVRNFKTLKWLCANAPSYGFFLQGSDVKSPEFEAWHWQYCLGDKGLGA
jgi:LAS superfamily LD-carboxypeptidase LdcB